MSFRRQRFVAFGGSECCLARQAQNVRHRFINMAWVSSFLDSVLGHHHFYMAGTALGCLRLILRGGRSISQPQLRSARNFSRYFSHLPGEGL